MAKGSYATLDECDNAFVYQWVTNEQAYVNVTTNGGETQTQWKYFRTYRKNGANQTFGITVHLVNGSSEHFTVNVEFAD